MHDTVYEINQHQIFGRNYEKDTFVNPIFGAAGKRMLLPGIMRRCDIDVNEIINDDLIAQMTPTIEISDDGYWVINGIKTDTKAIATDAANGADGVTPTIEISSDGYWVINGTKTEHKAVVDSATQATESTR